ncbi:MAG TPA: type III-B CRISPR module RAMP protein Cmr1 [Ktedonobacteraceae bacterium]|nr:type III-B CRISPR module RAMP protein Cmr1 [Ktedonobacteraceae bacterium]
MSRRQREDEPPPVFCWSERGDRSEIGGAQVITQTRTYKLITPLFGGGVEPGVNDPVTLIRGTEIRGQLRFWWRAIRGGQFNGDLAAMKKREDEIWGAASNTETQKERGHNEEAEEVEEKTWYGPVQIEIEVEPQHKGEPVKPFKIVPKKGGYRANPDHGIPDYAAFPLRPNDDDLKQKGANTPVADLQQYTTFHLKMIFLEDWAKEVSAALWAWETFGGVGARTRRGFGALQRLDLAPDDVPLADSREAEIWLKKKLECWYVAGTFPQNVPHIGPDMRFCFARQVDTPMVAWKKAIDKLKQFRQIPHGRDSRSKWPEAETIRDLTEYRHQKFGSLHHPHKFPRAIFGLPIVFHFKDEDKNKRSPRKDFDPPEMILQGAEERQDRWSSPLILRPLVCQNGKALSMACILDGVELPKRMVLKPAQGTGQTYEIAVSQTRLTRDETSILPILNGHTNVLQAFLEYFKG